MKPAVMDKMRVVVVSSLIAGSQYAHVINTVKMAEGFAQLGHKVTTICLAGFKRAWVEDLNRKYGIQSQFRWLQLRLKPNDQESFTRCAMALTLLLRPHLIYARNYLYPYYSSKLGFNTVGETHAHVGNQTEPFLKMMAGTKHKHFRLLITIAQVLADYYHANGAPKDKIAVLPDAVDLNLFERREVLPPRPWETPGPNIVYAGHLYDYKGIPTIFGAAKMHPEMNFHLIGGTPQDIDRQQNSIDEMKLKNVRLHGLKPLSEVPAFLWHADVLLLPPSADHPSAEWTSPLKLGEYLASETPVVASSIPALRNLLDDEVCFFTPDDPAALAAGIKEVLSNESYRAALVARGKKKAREWSYAKRAAQIIEKARI